MEPRHSQGEVGEVHRHQEEEEAEERVALSSLEEEGEVMVEHSLKGEEAEEAEEARH